MQYLYMKKRVNIAINFTVLLIAAIIFAFRIGGQFTDVRAYSVGYVLMLIIIVLRVKVLKAAILYFILVGERRLGLRVFLKQYCKTTPVSILFPYKTGDIFRIYCYSHQLNSVMDGLIFILVDRFFDTLALIGVVTFTSMIAGQGLTLLVYGLIFFVLVLVILYFALPKICEHWVSYLLQAPASRTKKMLLAVAGNVKSGLIIISRLISSKGLILFLMSVTAWGIELAGMSLLTSVFGQGAKSGFINDYLQAALGVTVNDGLNAFVTMLIMVLMITYVVIFIYERRKKG